MDPSRIGKADLARARALLSEARNELDPAHWKLLDNKLTEAEQAYQRFARAANSTGKATEVARGAERIAKTGRAAEASKGVSSISRAGPLLFLLGMLWPEETAGPEYDHGPPEWVSAQQEFEAKLRELSQAAQQVQSEMDTAPQAPEVQATRRSRPPRPNRVFIRDENWRPTKGQPKDPPCSFVGGAEPGLAPGWLRCTYICGKYEVELNDVFGSTAKECEKWVHLERAKKEALNWARVHDKRQGQ